MLSFDTGSEFLDVVHMSRELAFLQRQNPGEVHWFVGYTIPLIIVLRSKPFSSTQSSLPN